MEARARVCVWGSPRMVTPCASQFRSDASLCMDLSGASYDLGNAFGSVFLVDCVRAYDAFGQTASTMYVM